jgi:hypothetical protein
MKGSRTSLLIRLSHEDAARVHHEASSEYRSLSAYLLRRLETIMNVEEKITRNPTETLKYLTPPSGMSGYYTEHFRFADADDCRLWNHDR